MHHTQAHTLGVIMITRLKDSYTVEIQQRVLVAMFVTFNGTLFSGKFHIILSIATSQPRST